MSHQDHRSCFDNPEHWNPEIWQKSEADCMRAKPAGEWLPADIRSFLDAGCRNGVFANMMQGTRYMGALDLSGGALSGIAIPRLQANTARLPFPDDSFTAIVSMEMLEQPPQEIYQIVLGEFTLVASRYGLIAVPYKQKLEYFQVVCPACLCSFHPFHHLQSYQQSDFKNLFDPHTHLEKLKAVIPAKTEALPGMGNLIRGCYHCQGMNVPNTTVCQRCGFAISKNNIYMMKTTSSALVNSLYISYGHMEIVVSFEQQRHPSGQPNFLRSWVSDQPYQ
jgi:SAM-dependent methyltransferase